MSIKFEVFKIYACRFCIDLKFSYIFLSPCIVVSSEVALTKNKEFNQAYTKFEKKLIKPQLTAVPDINKIYSDQLIFSSIKIKQR